MKTLWKSFLPEAVLLALLVAAMTSSAIWWYEAKEQHRLRDTLIDQTLSAAEVFHKERHAETNTWNVKGVVHP